MSGKPSGKGVRGVRLDPKSDERSRIKIKTTQIINRLNAFVLQEADATSGKPVDMTPHQITAAVALLRKTLPDLTQISGALNHTHRKADELTDNDLINIAAGRSSGVVEEAEGAEGSDSLH